MTLRTLLNTIKCYQNPIKYYALFSGIYLPKITSLRLRSGEIFYVRPKKLDHCTLSEIYVGQVYQNALEGLSRRQSVVVDIGAHIGDFTLLASKRAKTVFAYEPEKDTLALCKKNIKVNKRENIFLKNYAVCGKSGTRKLYSSSTTTSSSSLFPRKEHRTYQEVQCVTLSSQIKEHKISRLDLLKLDCEGSEYEILKSLKFDHWRKINSIILEYHLWQETDYSLQDLTSLLKRHSFSIISIKRINAKRGILFAKRIK